MYHAKGRSPLFLAFPSFRVYTIPSIILREEDHGEEQRPELSARRGVLPLRSRITTSYRPAHFIGFLQRGAALNLAGPRDPAAKDRAGKSGLFKGSCCSCGDWWKGSVFFYSCVFTRS